MRHFGYTEQADAVIVLIDTGMRTGEFFKLRSNDVNFKSGNSGCISIWGQNYKNWSNDRR